jgi:hypothetical protein
MSTIALIQPAEAFDTVSIFPLARLCSVPSIDLMQVSRRETFDKSGRASTR